MATAEAEVIEVSSSSEMGDTTPPGEARAERTVQIALGLDVEVKDEIKDEIILRGIKTSTSGGRRLLVT